MSDVREVINKYWDKVKEHREWFHRHPELSHEEKETAAYIAKTLREIGLEPKENIGGYGVSAVIQGRGPGKCVGLRADFDALPITECTGLPYTSENPGVMHGCGHDTHAAMLLGAAYVLNELKNEFDGCVKLVFQPAEEDAAACGSKAMIEDGVLENPHVDVMFGQHVWPPLDTGKIGIRNGAMMASSDRFFITIHGKNSHGSAPEAGIDAIVIAAQVISALQSIVSRNVGPLDSAVVTIGLMKGGTRYNIIADTVEMEGTCRNLNPEIRNKMPERIENIIKGVSEGMGGSYDFKYLRCYSPTVNDPNQFELVRDVIREVGGDEMLVIPENSALGGEDFSFYTEKVPCAFWWLGCHEAGKPYYPIHSGGFYADEKALPYGMEVMVKSALKFLAH
ncbi:MAG: amidohydrolase [Lachnospiraceae bacterium]|nr:amidohydrolase [Lachnospiraceae bacterium]